jgi:hypothetical protein
MRAQRRAVCQLPLLASASAGVTIQREGFDMVIGGSPIVSEAHAARAAGRQALARHLQEARERTLALFAASRKALGNDLRVPCTSELNLPLWELGHVGWFADWWLARNPHRLKGLQADPFTPRTAARQAQRGMDADAVYDSSHVPHDLRWQLGLPSADETLRDLQASLQDTLHRLSDTPETDQGLYFFRLALFHEDMHAEAAEYMAQTLGHDPFAAGARPHDPLPTTDSASQAALLAVPATEWTLGTREAGFAFDNELPAHTVAVPAFEIDATPITWARYISFVETDGYRQRQWWSEAGWQWLNRHGQPATRYLRRSAAHVISP